MRWGKVFYLKIRLGRQPNEITRLSEAIPISRWFKTHSYWRKKQLKWSTDLCAKMVFCFAQIYGWGTSSDFKFTHETVAEITAAAPIKMWTSFKMKGFLSGQSPQLCRGLSDPSGWREQLREAQAVTSRSQEKEFSACICNPHHEGPSLPSCRLFSPSNPRVKVNTNK